MKIGVTRFPGTNCDFDVFTFVKELGHVPVWLWHQDQFNKTDVDAVVIPGGFSYGDYLRCGALAAKSPVMNSVRELAEYGKPVLGICNGFQILCESGLLPGALLRNSSQTFSQTFSQAFSQAFIDTWVELEVQNPHSVFAKTLKSKARTKLPIAHGEGRYFCEKESYQKMQEQEQIWLTYVDNPNGSFADIAGVMNQKKNVAGLMPHPERALWDWAGGIWGRSFL